MTTIEIRGVGKTFAGNRDTPALRDFSIDVERGELIAILGPSGCGKSTLLRCVAGLERPDSGTITIGGVVVSSDRQWVPPERRGLGMVFQSYALWPHLTVFENLAFPLRMLGRRKADIREAVAAALSTVGLADKGGRAPSQLSGGQQQRVALARAIVANPGVLLFDEPLSNLDVNLREAMRIELRKLKESLGWTGLFVTHDHADAVHLADRIVVLRNGEIQQVGNSTDLYERPANLFVAEFMGDVNAIPMDKQFLAGLQPAPGGARLPSAGGGILVLRPEWLRLTAPASDRSLPNVWRGTVKLSTDLGWYLDYVVDVEGVEMKVRGSAENRFRPQDSVDVVADIRRAIRFPA